MELLQHQGMCSHVPLAHPWRKREKSQAYDAGLCACCPSICVCETRCMCAHQVPACCRPTCVCVLRVLPCCPFLPRCPLQVRGALVLDEGELRWPAPPSAAPAPPPAPKMEEAAKGPKDLYPDTLRNALTTTGAAAATLAIGAVSPSSAFSGMLTKFGLASICGYQTVWGVSPALHSPLMSVTNAISGLTAVGGMVLAGGGVLPSNGAQVGGVECAACSR